MATSTEELRFRATGQDAGAGRMFDKLGDKADDAKDEVKGLDRQLGKLDEQLDLTKLHLAVLIDEFDKTGDKTLFKDIRKDRSTIAFLEKLRKEMRGVGDDSEEVSSVASRSLTGGLRDSLSSIPSELKGALIVGAVGAGAVMSPFLGAAVASAVLGGVGTGGIIGGIALAAQDERVAAAGKQIGQRLLGDLKADGQAFVGPLLVALDQVDDATSDLLSDIGDEFRGLSKLIAPLTRGLTGFIRNLGPGLSDALEAAEPIIRVLAQELPELGDSISNALSAISEESDGAAMGLAELFHIIEYGIEFTGDLVAGLSAIFEWLVRSTDAVSDFYESWNPLATIITPVALLHDETSALIEDLDTAKSSTDTYVGSVDALGLSMEEQAQATKDARQALVEYGKSIQDQFDPTANLFHKLNDLKVAHQRYDEAVKENGKNSREAKEALVELGEAALAVNAAALGAQGTFSGKFSPALIKIFHDAGIADDKIREMEKSLRAAKVAGEAFAKPYKAQLILDTSKFYGSLAAARNAAEGNEYVSGRASGGPVKAGKSYMVGENGPELVTFGEDGYVHPAGQTQGMLSGTSGGSVPAGWGSSPMAVQVEVVGYRTTGNALLDALIEGIQFKVRTVGGGDVNYLAGG